MDKKSYLKEYRKNNKEKINQYQRKWRSENKDKVISYQNRYWSNKQIIKKEVDEI